MNAGPAGPGGEHRPNGTGMGDKKGGTYFRFKGDVVGPRRSPSLSPGIYARERAPGRFPKKKTFDRCVFGVSTRFSFVVFPRFPEFQAAPGPKANDYVARFKRIEDSVFE